MEELPGQRPGSRIFFLGNEPFHIDSRYVNAAEKYYRCVTRTSETACPAIVFVPEGGPPEREGDHNHAVDPAAKGDCLFRQAIKDIAQDILLEPEEVLRQASERMPEAGRRCSVPAIKSLIKRVRAELLPPVPQTVAELGNLLEDYPRTADIYRGTVAAGGASAVVFASFEMLRHFEAARFLHIDGTFSVVPRTPRAIQLWIIFVRAADKGYAAVFVLCERRTKVLYDAIWQFLLNLCPASRENLRAVWTDFERAAIQSLRENFPRVSIHGCVFHYCRATYRKWKSLRMPEPPIQILYLSWALALLPSDLFEEGCQVITRTADPLAIGPLRALNEYTHYLRHQWAPLRDVVSVHGTPIRTNNVAESFNRHAPRKLGGVHPRIWVFLEKLKDTIFDELRKFARWEATGQTGRRPQHHAWVRADETIADHQRLLATGRYTVDEFLHAAMTPHQRLDILHAAENFPADGEPDHELPDPAHMLDPADVYPDNRAQVIGIADAAEDRPGRAARANREGRGRGVRGRGGRGRGGRGRGDQVRGGRARGGRGRGGRGRGGRGRIDPARGRENPEQERDDPEPERDDPVRELDDPVRELDDPVRELDDPEQERDDPVREREVRAPGRENRAWDREYRAREREHRARERENREDREDDPVREREDRENPAGHREGPARQRQERDDPAQERENPERERDGPAPEERDDREDDPARERDDREDDPEREREDRENPAGHREGPARQRQERDDPAQERENPERERDDPAPEEREGGEDPAREREDPAREREQPAREVEGPARVDEGENAELDAEPERQPEQGVADRGPGANNSRSRKKNQRRKRRRQQLAAAAQGVAQRPHGVKRRRRNPPEAKCVVCMGAEQSHIVVPCGHKCFCERCIRTVFEGNGNCPVCRVPFHAFYRFYNAML